MAHESAKDRGYRMLREAGYASGGDVAQDKRMITKAIRQHETQERDTLVHECIHMFLVQSGIRSMLEAHHGKRDGFEEFEESIVRVATPHLVGYLKGLR